MGRISESKRAASNRRERTSRIDRNHSRRLNIGKKDDFTTNPFNSNHVIEKKNDAITNNEENIVLNTSTETKMQSKQIAYEFLGKYYYDISTLSVAFAENWYEGQREVFGGQFSKYFYYIDSSINNISIYAKTAELLATKNDMDNDVIYFDFLYDINPKLNGFYWQGRSYNNISLLGQEMLRSLWKNDTTDYIYWNSILVNCILSKYYNRFTTKKDKQLFLSTKLENSAKIIDPKFIYVKANLSIYYNMAYLIADEKMFMCNERTFLSIDEFINYLNYLIENDFEKFIEICNSLINVNNELDPQFEAWLIALGKAESIAGWKNH